MKKDNEVNNIELYLDIIKECYDTLKRTRRIVGTIDPDFYLASTEYLLDIIERNGYNENKEC